MRKNQNDIMIDPGDWDSTIVSEESSYSKELCLSAGYDKNLHTEIAWPSTGSHQTQGEDLDYDD